MINYDTFVFPPSKADDEYELMAKRVQVFSAFSQMKKKDILKFFKHYRNEMVMALTNYFIENWNEYWGLFTDFSDDVEE